MSRVPKGRQVATTSVVSPSIFDGRLCNPSLPVFRMCRRRAEIAAAAATPVVIAAGTDNIVRRDFLPSVTDAIKSMLVTSFVATRDFGAGDLWGGRRWRLFSTLPGRR